MTKQPTLYTQRLILRSFTLADAPDVQRLANDREIAATTLAIPHPYEENVAHEWIKTHPTRYQDRQGAYFAIILKESQCLCGAVGLGIDNENNHGELGYWIGKSYWGQGYCSEAARAIVKFGFETLQLHRIHCDHFADNPASGRVMQKIGMKPEGYRRQHIFKWGEYKDIQQYGILKSDWQPY